jgi:hypothetical protein
VLVAIVTVTSAPLGFLRVFPARSEKPGRFMVADPELRT